jgi:hypothetical protein
MQIEPVADNRGERPAQVQTASPLLPARASREGNDQIGTLTVLVRRKLRCRRSRDSFGFFYGRLRHSGAEPGLGWRISPDPDAARILGDREPRKTRGIARTTQKFAENAPIIAVSPC